MTPLSRRLRTLIVWALLLMAVFGVSCQGRRPVYPVRGKVLFEGQPTPEALVIFRPLNDTDPNARWPIARARADGTFSPTTDTTEDGAPAGDYAVTVTWVKERDNQDAPKEEQRAPKNLLPDRYSKPETSGLRVTIRPGPNELETFHLKRK